MHEVASHDQQALRSQLEQVRARLDGFEQELSAIDGELENLAGERQRYELLHEVCGGLEKLCQLGADELFWDGGVADGGGEAHVRLVRARVDEFHRGLSEIESSRQAVIEKIQYEEENAELLEEDVFQAQRREDERKLEWLVERETSALPEHVAVMPWTHGGEDDQRFRKALAASILLSVLLGLLLPMIDLPLADPWEVVDVPERLTRLIREERLPPPPPVMELEAKPREIEPEPTEEPVLAEETPPKPEQKQPPKRATESMGILAFREKFSALAENTPDARLGAQARISRSGEASSGRPQRSLVTTQAPGSSGGINLAALSRDIGGDGGQQIEGVEVTRATSSIGDITGAERPLSGGPGPARTDEEIQIVFDRHKAGLYRLYNRELRKNPTLRGQIVLRIKIEPDGRVSLCEVPATDMKAPTLATQVVGRVTTFDFGAKEGVPAITILYPIDFLPAS